MKPMRHLLLSTTNIGLAMPRKKNLCNTLRHTCKFLHVNRDMHVNRDSLDITSESSNQNQQRYQRHWLIGLTFQRWELLKSDGQAFNPAIGTRYGRNKQTGLYSFGITQQQSCRYVFQTPGLKNKMPPTASTPSCGWFCILPLIVRLSPEIGPSSGSCSTMSQFHLHLSFNFLFLFPQAGNC